ncbi:MAG: homocysteine S-methyltransferase family protein [Gammaproteobacteria bacterium]|nr:homocysteine S-methyltransferase family protein [Gammaproteobacteria bacterium]
MQRLLLDVIKKRTLLSDGAMGTQLQAEGLESGDCGDYWNLSHPEKVEKIQKAYVAAGTDVLITNTFGGCRLSLTRYGHGDQVTAINLAATEIARRALGTRGSFVLGDIGPFGGLMEPDGIVTAQAVKDAFREQAEALVSGGVDGIIVETQTALEEAAIGVEQALAAGSNCVIVSFSFDVTHDGKNLFTMMGVSPEAAAEFAVSSGAHMIGINCGTGVDINWAIKATRRYRAVCDLPVIAQPNAGTPELQKTRVVYKQTPEQMTGQACELAAAGASIIGGCCGSTPAHIAALRKSLTARV